MAVYFNKYRNKWHARLQRNGVQEDLGFYVTKEEALEAVEAHKFTQAPERPYYEPRQYSRDWYVYMSKKQIKELTQKYGGKK